MFVGEQWIQMGGWKRNNSKHVFISHHNKLAKLLLLSLFLVFFLLFPCSTIWRLSFKKVLKNSTTDSKSFCSYFGYVQGALHKTSKSRNFAAIILRQFKCFCWQDESLGGIFKAISRFPMTAVVAGRCLRGT